LAEMQIRGPRYFNTDIALLKVTTITQTIGLQFRAAFFNIFNNDDHQRDSPAAL
jgi:hypothetical protein